MSVCVHVRLCTWAEVGRAPWGDAVHLEELPGPTAPHDVEAEPPRALGEADRHRGAQHHAHLLRELWH